LPENGVPRDDEPIPESSFGRLSYFFGAATQVLAGNPRLLGYLGINAAVSITLVWTLLSAIAVADPEDDPEATALVIPLAVTISILQSVLLHLLQCGLLVGALAALRGETVSIAEGFRVARSRFMPLVGLAIVMSVLGMATQFTSVQMINAGLGIMTLPVVLAWLGWFAVDLLAIALVAETDGSVMAYVVGAGRLIRRVWGDVLVLLLVFLVTTEFLAPILISAIASSFAGEDPSREALLSVASVAQIIRNLIVAFVYAYGARLYLFAVAAARVA
jgi:hypothetical protein